MRKNYILTAKQNVAWYQYLLPPDRRRILFDGGSRAGKTEVVLAFFIYLANLFSGIRLLVARKYKASAEVTIWRGSLRKLVHGCKGFVPREDDMELRFENGSLLRVAGLDDKERVDKILGDEYACIFINEATEADFDTLQTCISRLAQVCISADGQEAPRKLILDCNPKGPGHWLFKYIMRGLNPKDDTSLTETEEWSRLRWSPLDNPHLPKDYLDSLRAFDMTRRKRFYEGEWYGDDSTKMFRREWFPIVTDYPRDAQVCRYWDLAATRVRRPGDDPDWTCGGLVALHEGIWYILDMQRMRDTAASVEARIAQTAILDGREIMIRMEEEMGASGKSLVSHYARNILVGYDFKGDSPSGAKEVRAQAWAGAAEHGNVRLLSGAWNKAFLDEVEQFPSPDAHDDQTDCISGGCKCLSERYGTPHIYSAGPNPVIEKMLTDVDTEIDDLIASLPVDQRADAEQLRRTYAQ